jgi:NAD(P)-dependent dehydrogenase (short-subunit alcohol dehydrogenase family)
VVVVVGGSKGIGASVAKAYAQAGASVIVVTSRKLADLDVVAEELARIRPATQVVRYAVDVTDETQVLGLRDLIEETYGRLDVLIANAGVAPSLIPDESNNHKRFRPTVAAEDVADFRRVVDTNFVGSFIVANAFLPLLRRTRDGPQTVIFSSSASSLDTRSALVPASYNISKLAINRLAEHIHQDHFDKDGVVAISLHPGCIQTPISVDYPPLWDSSECFLCEMIDVSVFWLLIRDACSFDRRY